MNTVEKKTYQINERTIQTINYAALKISELNNEHYRHFVFNIEEIINHKQKVLDIIESETKWVWHNVYDATGRLIDSKSLATMVTFLVNKQIDLDTLLSNLRFTLKELLIENEDDNQFCFSISVKDSKINIADIADYLAEQTFLNFNFFYNDENDVLTMFSHAMVYPELIY
jgi:hypothetical protein